MMEEILRAAVRVWGIFRFDQQAAQSFENTPGAVGRSFLAAFLALPLYLLTVSTALDMFNPKTPVLSLVVILVLYQAIEWLLWPNLMVGVARWLNAWDRYCRYVAAYNWFALALMLLSIPLQLGAHSGMSTAELMFFALVVFVMTAVYEWFIAKHALNIRGQFAVGIVMMNLLVKMVLAQIMMVHLSTP